MLGTSSDFEALARKARKAGWTVGVAAGSNHLVWRSPGGAVARSALTPSSKRSVVELRLRLARADPETFGRGRGPAEPPPSRPAGRAEPELLAGLAELLGTAAELVSADDGSDPAGLAELVRLVRSELRDAEDRLRAAARSG